MRRAFLVAALALLGGCTHVGTYDARHFTSRRIASDQRLGGVALVLTTAEEDAATWSGRPTGFVGSAGTLVVPTGVLAREAARRVFAGLFAGGAEASHDAAGLERYRVVISPRVSAFEYHFPLSTIFTQRGDLSLAVHVAVRDGAGNLLLERVYASGRVEAEGEPGVPGPEVISRAAHEVAHGLLLRAAADVKAALEGQGGDGSR